MAGRPRGQRAASVGSVFSSGASHGLNWFSFRNSAVKFQALLLEKNESQCLTLDSECSREIERGRGRAGSPEGGVPGFEGAPRLFRGRTGHTEGLGPHIPSPVILLSSNCVEKFSWRWAKCSHKDINYILIHGNKTMETRCLVQIQSECLTVDSNEGWSLFTTRRLVGGTVFLKDFKKAFYKDYALYSNNCIRSKIKN